MGERVKRAARVRRLDAVCTLLRHMNIYCTYDDGRRVALMRQRGAAGRTIETHTQTHFGALR